MKIIKSTLLSVFILFFFSGCIEYKLTIKVKPDGSGTVKEKVILGEMITEMMASFMAMGGEENEEEFSMFDEEELRANASKMGKGVKFKKGEKVSEKNREGYAAVYSFKDINDLMLDQNPSDVMPMGDFDSNSESDGNKIRFKFNKGSVSDLTVIMPEEDYSEIDGNENEEYNYSGNEDGELNEADLEEVKSFFKDFNIIINLVVDGEISKTNATYVKENKITLLKMNFEKLMDSPEKLLELQKMNDVSVNEAKEFFKEIPGIKFELNEKINVQFK